MKFDLSKRFRPGFRLVAAAIVVGAVTLLAFDIATNESPSASGDTYDQIDAYVRDQVEDSRIPGVAIAIVEGDELVHTAGFGNDGRGHPIVPSTPFWIGSNTKSFTALATMQLVEAERVELDAPVQRYLPQFQVADEAASASMTVRHLLTQTSGFSRESGITPLLSGRVESLGEGVARLKDVDLATPPGQSFAYSNLNSLVLGLLIQEVTGQPWTEYIEEKVLAPLRMDQTYTSLDAAEEGGLTGVHRYWFGFPVETQGKYLPSLAPSGFLYASATDMGRYLSMYLGDGTLEGAQVLSGAGIETMLSPAAESTKRTLMSHEFEFRYGAGWFIGPFGVAEDARWHLGNLPYFTAWMVLLPETNQGVIVLINAGSQFEIGGANEVMSRIPIGVVNILRGEEPPQGLSIARFFIVANAVFVLVLATQVWSLLRVARGRQIQESSWRSKARQLGPLTWEFGAALAILLLVPAAFRLSWQHVFQTLPDLALFLVVVAAFWIITGLVRVGRLALR